MEAQNMFGVDDIDILVCACVAPKFKYGLERPCQKSDFEEFVSSNVENVKKLIDLLADVSKSGYNLHPDTIAFLCILFGENHELNSWNNEQIVSLCSDIECLLLKCLGVSNFEVLMVKGASKGCTTMRPILKNTLTALRPNLLKDTWKKHPASVQCYIWVIHLVSPPSLATCVNDVLPTALILSDDFIDENKISGVKCISQIIANLTIAELKFYGYGELMHKPLQHLLRERDPNIVSEVIPTILNLLTKLECNLLEHESSCKWSSFDDTLEILLEQIEVEHVIANRAVYISLLDKIVEATDIRILRWSKRLLRIFDHYLEVAGDASDYGSMESILKAMKRFLILAEPIHKWVTGSAVATLFRVFYHFSSDTQRTEANNRAQSLVKDCLLIVMKNITPSERTEISEALDRELKPIEKKTSSSIKAALSL